MPLSYAHSIGDGLNRNFDVPCEYLSKTHVAVRVDGVEVPFTWVDTYRVQTATAPAKNAIVEVRRVTPRAERMVTFNDGSTLVETDLNVSTLQSFFLAQEAFDQGAASMAVTEDGQFSALNRRITRLADPVNPQDAVTKAWALSAANTNLDAAVSAKRDAVDARTGSEAARSGAQTAQSAAEAARKGAEDARDLALSHRNSANTSKNAAETAQKGAEAAKVSADASKVTAEQKASEASSSAAAAKKSAQDAALFDPSSYYTKAQVSQMTGEKLSKLGDSMSGAFRLGYDYPQLWWGEAATGTGWRIIKDTPEGQVGSLVFQCSTDRWNAGANMKTAMYLGADGVAHFESGIQIKTNDVTFGPGEGGKLSKLQANGDVMLNRGDNTGYITWNAGNAYFGWDGSRYGFGPAGPVVCNSYLQVDDVGLGVSAQYYGTGDIKFSGYMATDFGGYLSTALRNAKGGLGIGQSWQDVAASRAANTVYQNTTGKPISVSVRAWARYGYCSLQVSSDNTNWLVPVAAGSVSTSDTTYYFNYSNFIVPPGHYYRLIPGASYLGVQNWLELR